MKMHLLMVGAKITQVPERLSNHKTFITLTMVSGAYGVRISSGLPTRNPPQVKITKIENYIPAFCDKKEHVMQNLYLPAQIISAALYKHSA